MPDDQSPRVTSLLGLTVKLSGTVRVSHPAGWTRRQVVDRAEACREIIARNLDVQHRRVLDITLHADDEDESQVVFALDQDAFPDDPASATFDPPEDDDCPDDAEIEDDWFEDDDDEDSWE